MYRIEGDGSFQYTLVCRDGELVPYERCQFRVNVNECIADVDGIVGKIDRMIISGIYTIISDGEFKNTKIFCFDEVLRGVQSLGGKIEKDHHPMIIIEAILLPNIVEAKDEE